MHELTRLIRADMVPALGVWWLGEVCCRTARS